EELVDDFIKSYLKQIIVDGFAHADPHPGNIHLTKKGKLALMDLGMVAKFNDRMREKILKLMIALGNNNGDRVTKVLLEMSQYEEKTTDTERFTRKVVRQTQNNQNSKAKDLKTGRSILAIDKMAVQEGIRLPIELTTLGKILLNMDQIIAFLSPEHHIQKTVKAYIERLMEHRMLDELKSGNVLQT